MRHSREFSLFRKCYHNSLTFCVYYKQKIRYKSVFSCCCQRISTTQQICNCRNYVVFRIGLHMRCHSWCSIGNPLYSVFYGNFSLCALIISLNFIFVVLIRARQFHIITFCTNERNEIEKKMEFNSSSKASLMKWNHPTICLAQKRRSKMEIKIKSLMLLILWNETKLISFDVHERVKSIIHSKLSMWTRNCE